MTKYCIRVHSIAQRRIAMLAMAKAYGVPMSENSFNDDTDDINKYPYVHVACERVDACIGGDGEPTLDFTELDKLFQTKPNVTVKLNSEYSAVISEKGIAVGCQNFTFEKFSELANAVTKYKSS